MFILIISIITSGSDDNSNNVSSNNDSSNSSENQNGGAVEEVDCQETIGSTYLNTTASEGGTYLLVKVSAKNIDDEARYLYTDDFKIVLNDVKYDYSSDAVLYLSSEDKESIFLENINPGITLSGWVVFEVPSEIVEAESLQLEISLNGKEYVYLNIQ